MCYFELPLGKRGALVRVARDGTEEPFTMRQPLRIVIVGNGVAGIRAALVARQRDSRASITVISGETDYFFSRTALMYAYMDSMTRRDLEPHERKSYAKQNI